MMESLVQRRCLRPVSVCHKSHLIISFIIGPYFLDKNTAKEGEITGMYLIDREGILETRDVNARFVNGKPEAIESIYIMKSPEAWDRFMRFMERYGKTNGLVFTKAN